jgi:hypothetical protein
LLKTNASDIGYGGILRQKINPDSSKQIVRFHSGVWTKAQSNYSIIKKEILSIILYVDKFQTDLLNKKFLIRIDCKSAKHVLEKDVQNIASKQVLAHWQSILSVFYFNIKYIKGSQNSIPDFLTREFLQNKDGGQKVPKTILQQNPLVKNPIVKNEQQFSLGLVTLANLLHMILTRSPLLTSLLKHPHPRWSPLVNPSNKAHPLLKH